MSPTLSIIIPVYNEEHTVIPILKKVLDVPLKGVGKQIIIVDDGSSDHTHDHILAFLKETHPDNVIVISKSNEGKGSAIRTGLKQATGDIVVIQDADLEYDPKDYQTLIDPILQGKAAVVYGSRYMLKEQRRRTWSDIRFNYGFLRHLSFLVGSQLLTATTNLLYGTSITDEPTGYKVFTSTVLNSIELRCVRFEFCPEVTAKVAKKGHTILEVPISYNPRTVEEGKKIRWRDGVEAMWTLFRVRFSS